MSTVATGTAPLSVSSTTVVTNLNADLLDGSHRDTAYNSFGNGTIPLRHPSGYLFTNYINTTADVTATAATQFAVQTGNDDYLRWQTPANARSSLGLVSGGAGDIWVDEAGDTMTGNLTMSGAAANISLGTNYLSGDGGDEGIYVLASGNVGIGTTGPNEALHVATNGNVYAKIQAVTGSGQIAGIKLQRGTYGTDTYTDWIAYDSGGNLFFDSYHQSFGQITQLFINDPTENTNIGIGTTVPLSKLSVGGVGVTNAGVYGTATTYGIYGISSGGYGVYGTSTSGTGVYANSGSGNGLSAASSTNIALDAYRNQATSTTATFRNTSATCTVIPGGTGFSCASDLSLKKNILTIDNSLEKLMDLRGVYFNWKTDKDSVYRNVGFIAQEVEQVVPELVFVDPDTGIRSMNYGNVTPLLVNAVQEQQLQINNLADLSLVFNNSGELLFDNKIAEIKTEQVNQSQSIKEILSELLRLGTLEDSLSTLKDSLDLLADRLNKWDEVMEWSQETADSFASLIFKVPTVFSEMAIFEAPIKVNADTSETIEIPEGTLKAKITFTKSFPEKPSIYINFVGTVPVDYELEDVSVDGFSISFKEATSKKFEIQWLAILRNKSDNSPSVEIIQSDSAQDDEEKDSESETPAPVADEEETVEIPVEEQTGIIPVPVVEESSESMVLSTADVEEDEFGISQEGTIDETIEENTYSGIEIGGVVLIEAGEVSAIVETSELSESSTVKVSTEDTALITVKVVENGKFEITLDQTYSYDVNVTWVITN
mgnify:CR=1 FL=1